MITIDSNRVTLTSPEEIGLHTILRKIGMKYSILEDVSYDEECKEYRAVVLKTDYLDISNVLQRVVNKTFERNPNIRQSSFFTDFSLANFLSRMESQVHGEEIFPGLERLLFIWDQITLSEKQDVYQMMLEKTDGTKSTRTAA